MINVMVADDHEVVRDGLVRLIAGQEDMDCIGEASNVNELVRLMSKSPPDVVVIDVSMPGKNGIEALPLILSENPKANVLMFTMHPAAAFATRAFKNGAKGYIGKDAKGKEILSAIRQVAKGSNYITKEVSESLLDSVVAKDGKPHEALSTREFEVFNLICDGLSNIQISDRLNISQKTVHTHKAAVMSKLSCTSDVALLAYAIKHKLRNIDSSN